METQSVVSSRITYLFFFLFMLYLSQDPELTALSGLSAKYAKVCCDMSINVNAITSLLIACSLL